MIQLGVYRLGPEVKMPEYRAGMSACFDLSFCPIRDTVIGYNSHSKPIKRALNSDKSLTIHPRERFLIPTGLVFKLSELFSVETFADITKEKEELRQFSIRLYDNYELALKKGITLVTSEGIVDVDYQQEVFVMLTNVADSSVQIQYQEVVANGEVVVNELVKIIELTKTPVPHSNRFVNADEVEAAVEKESNLSLKGEALAAAIADLD